jgi:excisionase family DNA binding protein
MLEEYNEVLRPIEVCEILAIGKNTLYNLLNTEQLVGYKSGKNWRVTKQAVISYINSKSVGGAK